MKNLERLIGRKARGFKFEGNQTIGYDIEMNKYIGIEGTIKRFFKEDNTFLVSFKDANYEYPADQIEAHLVDDEEGVKEEIKQELSKNKVLICNSDLKIEDEIPTLSDGVMMLVSNYRINNKIEKVFFKHDNKYYIKCGSSFETVNFAKPIEPTKEEQLTKILGSSEKVSEIMELFKNYRYERDKI